MSEITKKEVIIVGSGPAGLTAAIYCARSNLKPLCIEGYQKGGQLMLTTDVENYPGFPEGRMGPDLMKDFRDQAERFGTEFLTADVTKVDLSGAVKKLWVGDKEFHASAVIVSTGASANLLGLENEKKLMGKGVSTCATCDGFFFGGKEIAVIGGGDSAMEEANFLTKFASKVYLIHRRESFRASNIMVDRAKANPKIEFITSTTVEDFLGSDELTALKLKNTTNSEIYDLPLSGAFVAIGHTPNTKLFSDSLTLDEKGYIQTSKEKTSLSNTNIEGVFACGDVQDTRYRQAITAAGSGCMAALDAEHFLENKE